MQTGMILRQSRNGVTLIEILLTVGIVAILAATVIQTIRPKETIEDTNDAKRKQDLKAMIDALYQYQIDHNRFPSIKSMRQLDTTHNDVCSLPSVIPNDLLSCNFTLPPSLPLGTLIPQYLANLPRDPDQPGDPEECDFANFSTIPEDCITGYQLWLDDDGRIHAFAPLGNNSQGIELAF